jgi:hypothetical protein
MKHLQYGLDFGGKVAAARRVDEKGIKTFMSAVAGMDSVGVAKRFTGKAVRQRGSEWEGRCSGQVLPIWL